MGKRCATTSPGKPQPAAKARASLQAAFARSAKDQVTPDIFSLDYEGWKLAVINQSRQYYAQRTDGWMRALWEKAKANAGHELAGAFLQGTHSVPADKTPWVYNPKEICTIFEAFVSERHEAGMAHSSRTDSETPASSESVRPARDQTATGAAVDADEAVGSADGLEANPPPENVEKNNAKRVETDQEMVDAAASAESKGDLADSAKPEKSDQEMVDAAASAESKGDLADSAKPEKCEQEMVDAAASAESKGDLADSAKPEKCEQEMVDAAAASKGDLADIAKPEKCEQEMVDAAAAAESKGDLADTAKPEKCEQEMVDAAAAAESIDQKQNHMELEGSASAATAQAAIGCGDDQVKLDRLLPDAVAACMQHDRLASHIEMVREQEGLGEADWVFADPEGDPISDLFTFREWLEDRKLDVPRPLAAVLDLWEEMEEKRLSAMQRVEPAAPALDVADSQETVPAIMTPTVDSLEALSPSLFGPAIVDPSDSIESFGVVGVDSMPEVDQDGRATVEAVDAYLECLFSKYPDTENMYDNTANIMAGLILKHHSLNPESNVSSTLALLPSDITAASGCTGTGSFEACLGSAIRSLFTVFPREPPVVELAFACESVPFKQRFAASCVQNHAGGCADETCMFEDITCLLDDDARKCVTHQEACSLPLSLDCFGAGFSCTSYSLLNVQAKQNAGAMDRMAKHGAAAEGEVQSVSTFQGCIDILDKCKPLWTVFENVESIDREVDPNTQTNLEVCLKMITERGYSCQSYLLDASWYGSPQTRRRVYIICLSTSHVDLSINAQEFFTSVKSLLQAMQFPAPPADRFLLPDDHPAVAGYLAHLEGERDTQKKKAEESTAAAKVPAWISLHMQVAEKRGVVWPLHIEPSLAGSPWFKVLTDRTKEVVGFAHDEVSRMGRCIEFADVYHSANRYSTGQTTLPIVLPRSQVWSLKRNRLLLGREALAIQGHPACHSVLDELEMTEGNFQDLAGNSFSGNVILAVIMAILCSLRFNSPSEAEENEDIHHMLSAMSGKKSN